MSIYLSHETALAYWTTRVDERAVLPAHIVPQALTTADVCDIDDSEAHPEAVARCRAFMVACGAWTQEDAPQRQLHIMVSRRGKRGVVENVSYHLGPKVIPKDAFVCVAPGIYVSSPEYCVLQLANTMTELHALVEVVCELCAVYAIGPEGQGMTGQRFPFTCCQRILDFLDHLSGARGVARARLAVSHATDFCFSIMETNLAVELKLPLEHGGRAFPSFTANKAIFVDDPSLRGMMGGRKFVRGDIVLDELQAVFEYDSYEEHAGKAQLDHTQTRAGVLRSMGYLVISLTYGQVSTNANFDVAIWMAEEQIGLQHPKVDHHIRCRQHEVHDFLMQKGRRF